MSKKLFGVGFALVCLAGLTGCEYESSGDADSWNSSASWVNFSGVYKASGGGVLVSDFTLTGDFTTDTNGTIVVNVNDERIGTGQNNQTVYSGFLNRKPVVVGSVSISAAGFNLEDQGNGSLSGSGVSGTIDYGTGAWSIDLGDSPLGSGVPITADYQYSKGSGSGGGGGGGGSGSSGKPIYSFTVFQTGNKLEITDNNGASYVGQFGRVATTTGGTTADVDAPSVGDSAVAEYTAEGISAAGVRVMMTGTFQGTVGRGSGSAYFLGDRRMLGTWVEPKITGDINGLAAPIGFTVTTTETTTE